MPWSFLHRFRGTTNGPDLASDHPLRRALTRYGVCVARNVATTLLISVAVATALVYPIPFLYTSDFTSDASSLPKHVWTNAQPIKDGGGLAIEPDVIMRSIWVHGSYMKALDCDVLLGALGLQDTLLGPTKNFDPRRPANTVALPDPEADLTPAERDTFHVVNGLTNQSWFFHSPLLYWLGDRDAIQCDPDILATVNERKKQHTSVNVTLRHAVVFSGKRFEERALVAADALVITLIHLRDSPVGRQWERKAAHLAAHPPDPWDAYPKDAARGGALSSQLYEFRFLPMSWQDSVLLALAYSLAALYLLQNLAKLPAIKSRPGLILTVVAQVFVCIMSSFTVCAVLRIDLSRIPRAAYPIVIVSLSLENITRLIRGVMATNAEHSTSSRIGEAFGKTAPMAFWRVIEHLLLLWGLSKLVTDGLADFCAFLAIAIVFDFVCLSTLFLSVLSIELRRFELCEIFEKAASRRRPLPPVRGGGGSGGGGGGDGGDGSSSYYPPTTPLPASPRPSWMAAMRQGRADISTRIAGTVILLGFVVIGQWHFFENESMSRTLHRLVSLLGRVGSIGGGSGGGSGGGGGGSSSSSSLVGGHNDNNLTALSSATSAQFQALHQARSLTSWLRLQDHETAEEVISVVKPWAHSYVARVYEPLVFVLRDSDRMPSVTEPRFLPAVYDFVHHQLTPFVVSIVVVTAAMHIFVSYLLWDEASEAGFGSSVGSGDAGDAGGGGGGGSGEQASAPLLSVRTLDHGHALDVAMLVASPEGLVVSVGLDRSIRVWNVALGGTSDLVTSAGCYDVPFPVLALAVDDGSTWLAILSSLQVTLWHLETKQWGASMAVDLYGQRPEAFFFAAARSLVVVRRNGTFVELWPETGTSLEHAICRSPILCAIPLQYGPAQGPSTALVLLTASRNGCIHRVTPVGDQWISEEVKQQAGRVEQAQALVALPHFAAYLVVRPRSVDLVDVVTSETLHTFAAARPIRARTLRYVCAVQRQAPRGSGTRAGAGGGVGGVWAGGPSPELRYFGLVYTSSDAGGPCVVQAYLPRDDDGSIVFYPEGLRGGAGASSASDGSCRWYEAREAVKEVANPGVWEALPNGCIIGVRQAAGDGSSSGGGGGGGGRGSGLAEGGTSATGSDAPAGRGATTRRRGGGLAKKGLSLPSLSLPSATLPSSASAAGAKPTAASRWEAWSLCSVVDGSGGADSSAGRDNRKYATCALEEEAEAGALLVAEAGPMARVGAGTVAVGLGTGIKVITTGHERFGSAADMLEAAAGLVLLGAGSVGKRRRKNRSRQRGG